MRSLFELLTFRQSNDARARETIEALGELPQEDLARSAYEAAAVTFALLHLADRVDALATTIDRKFLA